MARHSEPSAPMRGSQLEKDALKGHVVKSVVLPSKHLESWECPFCLKPGFIINIKGADFAQVRDQIRDHIEIHRHDVEKALEKKNRSYDWEERREESERRAKIWIDGTVNDRGLYKEEDF
ncbi:hypothetical protein BCR43DRAFT_527491 [Syncephalastrum racemosum]|uniref:Uncharacterized protein n=1 Tax=Syncephalastrum racemosum TaxID=13706 RepID=A0A1X2H4B7_SYNRA|nr:hypothetical protein BCR43DRAFT_527491 [Syncephalastrum racemosum]